MTVRLTVVPTPNKESGVWCLLYDGDGISFNDFFHPLEDIEQAQEYIKKCKGKMLVSPCYKRPIIMTCLVLKGDHIEDVHSFLLKDLEVNEKDSPQQHHWRSKYGD